MILSSSLVEKFLQASNKEFFRLILELESLTYNTSFNFLPSNTLKNCMAALLGIVESVRRKEQGRQTGRRSSQLEQTPHAQHSTNKRWETKNISGST